MFRLEGALPNERSEPDAAHGLSKLIISDRSNYLPTSESPAQTKADSGHIEA
jgi:hypothetical protein